VGSFGLADWDNKINERKEFFRLSIEDIITAVQDIDEDLQTCRSEVKFTKIAEAAEFRKTSAKEREDLEKKFGH